MKLTELLKESQLNEINPRLNKKVKKYLDAYMVDTSPSDPEFHHAISVILRGALTDANFHSEAKKVDGLFPKAKKAKSYKKSSWEDNLENKGIDISKWAKWDGHDILDAFAFYTNMTIGGGFGNKLSALKEGINESVIIEGKFQKDDLVYNKRTKTVGIVRLGDDKSGEVKTDADGNVDVDELEKYNPIKNKHQQNAKVAPSTEKEVSKRGLFNPFKNESITESSDTYFKSFGAAADAARAMAEKRGFEITEHDWQTQVAMGGKYSRSRPSVGKTTSFTVGLTKGGKSARKALTFSVYGMDSGNFELTAYIN